MLLSERLEANEPAPNVQAIALRIDREESYPISYYRQHSPELLKATLVKALVKLYLFYGTDEVRAVQYIQLLLESVFKRYWHLTPEDIQLFAERAMLGHYGKVYGQLTPAVVMQWLDEYSVRRYDEIEGIQINAHNAGRERYTHRGEADTARRELDKLLSRVQSKH